MLRAKCLPVLLNHVLCLREIKDDLDLLLLFHLRSYFSLDLSLLSVIAKIFSFSSDYLTN